MPVTNVQPGWVRRAPPPPTSFKCGDKELESSTYEINQGLEHHFVNLPKEGQPILLNCADL